MVSDSGGVFLAKQAQAIYAALGIEKREIARGRPWQNYIEANFGTMRRMADYHFAQAATWPEMHAVYARFFHDYNHQKHFEALAAVEWRPALHLPRYAARRKRVGGLIQAPLFMLGDECPAREA